MSRMSGRRGRLYLSTDGTAAPTPVDFLNRWSIQFTNDKNDVTSFGDNNKVYTVGLPDASGSVAGYYDGGATGSGSDALYNAATDGLARNFYLYMDTSAATVDYFYGSAYWDFSSEAANDGAVTISANFTPAGTISLKKS